MRKKINIFLITTLVQILIFLLVYEVAMFLGNVLNITSKGTVSYGITIRIVFLSFLIIAFIGNALYLFLKKPKRFLIITVSFIAYALLMYLFNDMSITPYKALLLLFCGFVSFLVGKQFIKKIGL